MSNTATATVRPVSQEESGIEKKAEFRKRFGKAGGALVGTRMLSKPMEHFQDQGINAHSVILINDDNGTFTQANVYDGNLGKNYSPENYTHELKEDSSKKWKGYSESTPETVGAESVLVLLDAEVAEDDVAE